MPKKAIYDISFVLLYFYDALFLHKNIIEIKRSVVSSKYAHIFKKCHEI